MDVRNRLQQKYQKRLADRQPILHSPVKSKQDWFSCSISLSALTACRFDSHISRRSSLFHLATRRQSRIDGSLSNAPHVRHKIDIRILCVLLCIFTLASFSSNLLHIQSASYRNISNFILENIWKIYERLYCTEKKPVLRNAIRRRRRRHPAGGLFARETLWILSWHLQSVSF